MPRKRKAPTFRAVETVKAMARERIGAPKATKVVPGKKAKVISEEKHKQTLARLLADQ